MRTYGITMCEVLIILTTVAIMALVGCKSDPGDAVPGMRVITDADTGCEYLRPNGGGAATPRNDATGKQICNPPTVEAIR